MKVSFIRWADGKIDTDLATQLRRRSREWAVIAEGLAWIEAKYFDQRNVSLGEEFEIEAQPYDAGPAGRLYRIEARYVGRQS